MLVWEEFREWELEWEKGGGLGPWCLCKPANRGRDEVGR